MFIIAKKKFKLYINNNNYGKNYLLIFWKVKMKIKYLKFNLYLEIFN